MTSTALLRKDLIKIVFSTMMALFLVPLIAWSFVRYAVPPEAADIVTEPFSPLWQFQLTRQISAAILIAGVIMLLVICALGAAAFINRRAQYLSFVAGWRLLTLFCAIEVVIQGTLLVWLAFWVTAFFFKMYFLKLIVIAAILAALGVFHAVACIFKSVPQTTDVEGELIDKNNATSLWAHVQQLAAKAETAPPDNIVAGIDTNFFVTEAPLSIKERTLTGRSLFVSVPLLRLLDRGEADAVLMHELAHFRGGDTTSNAKLGPILTRYDFYCGMMHSEVSTLLVFYVLRLYRVIFEFALKRDSRAREFLADRAAAALVSAQGIVHSLIKISGYAGYRAVIEEKLFAEEERHESQLKIADRIADGLAPYAASAQFLDEMREPSIPHPFDSHPALQERMRNVGFEVSEQDYSQIVTQKASTTWIPDIPDADDIEQALWTGYEDRFTSAHEQKLAYCYQPSSKTEEEIVLKYFPPVEFELRGGKRITITYQGLMLPETTEILSWDSVANMQYEDAFGSDILQIIHPEKGWCGAKTTKIKLPGIRKQRAQLKEAMGRYWQRHQIMRKGWEN